MSLGCFALLLQRRTAASLQQLLTVAGRFMLFGNQIHVHNNCKHGYAIVSAQSHAHLVNCVAFCEIQEQELNVTLLTNVRALIYCDGVK